MVASQRQGIIQKKSASGSWMLSQDIFSKCYFDLKMPKMVFKQGYLSISNCHLPNKMPFYSSKCPFFLLFQTLPYDSKLFPDRQILKSLLVVSISFKQLPLSYFTTLACKSLSSVSYCQSREFRVYLEQMIIDSRGEIRELPRVQSTEQILLMPAAVYQFQTPPFLLLLKPGALPISDLKV